MGNFLTLHNAEKQSFTVTNFVYYNSGTAENLQGVNVFIGPTAVGSITGFVIEPYQTIYIGNSNSILQSDLPFSQPPNSFYVITLENPSATFATIIYENIDLKSMSSNSLV